MSTNNSRSAVTRNSVSTFSTLRKCVALAVFGTGVLSAADPDPECPIATVDVYVASFGFGRGTCTITATTPTGGTAQLTISQFTFIIPGNGLSAANLLVTPLRDTHGLGFQITPTVPWTPPGNGRRLDDEVQYVATVTSTAPDWPGIDRLYTELNGAVVPPGFDQVVEVYCPGGFTLPPDQFCPATNGLAQTLYVGPTPAGTGTTVLFRGALYSPGPRGACTGAFSTSNCVYRSIAVNKNMDANASLGGSATITRVVNQFGPPVTCFQVLVGYADSNIPARPNSPFFPSPWQGDPGVTFIGQAVSGNQFDAGAIRIDNTCTIPVTVNKVEVTIDSPAVINIWGGPGGLPVAIPPGGKLILTQTVDFNFDTSDMDHVPGAGPGARCLGGGSGPPACATVFPTVTVTTTQFGAQTFNDTGHVLDTEGFDFAIVTTNPNGAGTTNESHCWRPIGNGGGQCPIQPQP